MDTSVYHSPFDGRYTSQEMNELFSDDTKFKTWRMLWVALAKAEQKMGLPISDEQIAELEKFKNDINYDVANAREKAVRHDVMAHVFAYGQQAKSAAGIIHLGATSCFVTDNTDLLNIWDGLNFVRSKLLGVIKLLAKFADEHKSLPTLGYTHYQAATPTTVGKRATLWLQNFVNNLHELDFVMSQWRLLGCRGATGSSESFMELFHGDEEKVRELEYWILEYIPGVMPPVGYDGASYLHDQIFSVSGQTYPRNYDLLVINALAGIAASAYKMAQDIRLLQHDKELEEPFAKNQIGSSAMAYKRNPMRSERICSLARFVSGLPAMAWQTAATQMLERTLDDSAGRRIYLPDAFRAVDAILILCGNVTDGIVVNRGVISARLDAELPFMITEAIIMRAVEKGADRQEMHARVREISLELGNTIKKGAVQLDEVKRIFVNAVADDPAIPLGAADIDDLLSAERLIGCCPSQVTGYLEEVVNPLLVENSGEILVDTEVKV